MGHPKTIARHGRRTYYTPEYAEQAYRLALLGCTDQQLAEAFCVGETCLKNWRKRYPEFREAIRSGKENADARVAKALLDRALGYEAPSKQRFEPDDDGKLRLVEEVREWIAPDVAACRFWLRNRQPDKWREGDGATAVAQAGAVAAAAVTVAGVSEDVLERLRANARGEVELPNERAPVPG